MDELSEKNIIKNIFVLYKNNKISSQNSYMFFYIIIIFIVLFIYLMIEYNRQSILLDWNNNRCNPKYMFMAGFIQKDVKDGVQYTYDNFLECTQRSKVISDGIKKVNSTNDNLINTAYDIYNDGMIKKDDIDREIEKLNKDSINNEQKFTNISNTMDLIYTQHQRIYNIMNMYVTRLTFVIKNIYDYIGNVLLYKIYNHKKKMDIDNFHNEIKTEYLNIINGDVNKCYNSYNNNRRNSNYQNLDYKECIDFAANATNRLLALKDKIDKFNTENIIVKQDIEKLCDIFDGNIPQFSNYNCKQIFTNYTE